MFAMLDSIPHNQFHESPSFVISDFDLSVYETSRGVQYTEKMFSIIYVVLFPFVILLVLYIHHRLFLSRYWSRKNVPHLEPIFLLGNACQANFTENLILIIKKMYLEHRDKKMLGFWLLRTPILLVNDPDLIRRIFIKDFDVFRNRVPFDNTKTDPLTSHLFLLSGKRWRNLRVKLTPTFTSGKMKMMFPTMMDCGHQLRHHLVHDGKEIEVKDLMARFTTYVISSCAFGIETNSMKNPDSEFRKYGSRIVEPSLRSVAINILRNIYPPLIQYFRIRTIPKDISDFFINAVKDTVAYRRQNNQTRNDFLQLLIELINKGKVTSADKENDVDDYTFDEIQAAAQCFVFFLAGFETSSTALSFGLYELALNPDVQTKLQKEIDEVLSKGEVTYDRMCDMQYLDMVVHEILRKYPSLGILTRCNSKEYRFPDTNTVIEKNTRIFFSALGIHYNPEYYPEPNRFDPERFSPEEKKKRDPMTYLPFGDGPRNCIGSRFGLMQMKIGLLSILRENTVEVCEKTPIPFTVDVKTFFLSPVGGLPLVFKTRAL